MPPPELNDRLIAEIVAKIRITGSVETGLLTNGVDPEEFYAWRENWRDGTADPPAARLCEAVLEAEGDVKMLREHQLNSHFEKNWQALAWWLERRYPREYGPRAKENEQARRPVDDVSQMLDLLPSGE